MKKEDLRLKCFVNILIIIYYRVEDVITTL